MVQNTPGRKDHATFESNQENAGFLDLVAQRVPANIFVFNLKTGASEFNSAAVATLIGYTNEDIVQFGDRLLEELLHPDDVQIAQNDLLAAASLKGDNFSAPVEYRMKAKSGEWIWFASTMRVFDLDDDGNVMRVIGAAHPITRQKAAEAELREAVELQKVIVDVVPSGIIGLNSAGDIVSINETARVILDDPTLTAPCKWPDGVRFLNTIAEPLSETATPIARTRNGDILRGELFCLSNQSDQLRFIEVSNSGKSLGASPIQFILVLNDVTEQEKQRQKIERSNRLDALGQLTGGIAHDFNNLLATLQYALRLIKIDECSEKQLKHIEIAFDSVRRGSDLTKRLLGFARQQPGLKKSLHVGQVIHNAKQMAETLIEAQIEFQIDVPAEDLWVFCDNSQLDNALINLILNSRDAILSSGKGDRITLFARSVPEVDSDSILRREHPNSYIAQGQRDEHAQDQVRQDNTAFRYIEFGVTDNGPGMPPEVRRRAVDPFFSTKSHGSGAGLGLSTIYGFVQQSDGELRIYSEAEQGTTIRILLPRGTRLGEREQPVKLEPRESGAGEKILLVEDDHNLLSLMDDLVSSFGYRTACTRSAKDALTLVGKGDHFDLMITDIVMPGDMDGFALASEMRQVRPDMKLLYMSGYTGYSERDMGEIIAPLLQKPCEPVELAQAIRHQLSAMP